MNEFAYQLLPYCLQKMEDKIGGWIVLNRQYKPFNFDISTNKWAKYEDVPKNSRIKRLSITQMKLLHHYCYWDIKEKFEITNDTKKIYLYSDNCNPILSDTAWSQYSKKLQRLAKYQTK
jgi:hypothetical protein|tara:strand:- start:66 stop:422 length:357 start_codon:yes stop_codon:yes gene_type:complete